MRTARSLLTIALLASCTHLAASEPDCHAAAELVEPALLSGPWHTVDPCVRVAGHLYQFELHTTFGVQPVESEEMLSVRIAELPALAALAELGTPELGVRAFGTRGYEHGERVVRLARQPVATLAGLPRGALAFFQRRWSDLSRRAIKYGDRARDTATNADDLYDAPSARPGLAPPAGDGRSRTAVAQAGRELERQVRSELSFNATRRRWAERLGVDPYTTNPRLREELERVTWAAIVGETAADAAFSQLPADAVAALDIAKDVDQHVWQAAPSDLAKRNGERLVALGCGELEARRLLRNGGFTPPLQSALVETLEALEPGARCSEIADLAAALRGEVEARYLVNALDLLDRWAPDTTHRAIELVGTTPVVRTPAPAASREAPAIVLPLAVDRLEWTAETRAFFDLPTLRVAHKLAIVRGELSPRAARALTRRGWSIVERAAPVRERAVAGVAVGRVHPAGLLPGS